MGAQTVVGSPPTLAMWDGMVSSNLTHEHPVCVRGAMFKEKERSQSGGEDQGRNKQDHQLTDPSFHDHQIRRYAD